MKTKQKTYAFFDLLGTKRAFEAGTADSLLGNFWTAAETWSNHHGSQPLPLDGQNAVQSPRTCVRTFSDSAILWTREEHKLEAFYALALSLKVAIEKHCHSACYCIINRDDELAHHTLPATGASVIDDDMVRGYENIGGSGRAWVNLLYADAALGRLKEWHGKFTLYCVGSRSISSAHQPQEKDVFSGFAKQPTELFAIA